MSNTYIEDIRKLDFDFKEKTVIFEERLEVKYLPSDETVIYAANNFIHYEINSNQSIWNDFLIRNTKDRAEINKLIENIYNSTKELNNKRYSNFLEKVKKSFENYEVESKENIKNKFEEPSINSFFQLIRFLPEYPENNTNVYLDEKTGFFGITIKPKLKGKPILNLLMKDNKEIIFSFIKRKNGIVKITGRAYFNENLDDSDEIKKILRMFYE